jgi:hypothetical protein
MGIVKIANQGAERLLNEIPAFKPGMRYSQRARKEVPVYRIVWGVSVIRLAKTPLEMICWDDLSLDYPCPVAYLIRVS